MKKLTLLSLIAVTIFGLNTTTSSAVILSNYTFDSNANDSVNGINARHCPHGKTVKGNIRRAPERDQRDDPIKSLHFFKNFISLGHFPTS